MDKEIYPDGSVVVVTTTHSLYSRPYVGVGTKVTIDGTIQEPYSNDRYYRGLTEVGTRVMVRGIYVTLVSYPEPEVIREGSLVFVTETHSTSKSSTNYAGTHLVIDTYVSAETAKKGEAFYWAKGVDGTWCGSVRADKIALVETAPEKLTPPVAPNSVGKQGEVVWTGKDTELGGYWTYDNYWGWSNFVPTKAVLYREPVKGEDMSVNGVLATSALDGTVQAV